MIKTSNCTTQSEPRTIGVVMGRFQPFHLSHLSSLERDLEGVDKLIILVSDLPRLNYRRAPKFFSAKENPFSYGERKEMIARALEEDAHISSDKFSIQPFTKYLLGLHRKDNDQNTYLVASHEKLSKYLKTVLKRKGRQVKTYGSEREVGIHASEIRSLLRDGRPWEHLVPMATAEVIRRKAGRLS